MAFRWWPRNWADTSEPGDPPPFELAMSLPQALEHVRRVIDELPRWQVEHAGQGEVLFRWEATRYRLPSCRLEDLPTAGVKATRRTRLWGFVDDVTLTLVEFPGDPPQTYVLARSQSRVGLSDLGQNRRNLQELFAALKQEKIL